MITTARISSSFRPPYVPFGGFSRTGLAPGLVGCQGQGLAPGATAPRRIFRQFHHGKVTRRHEDMTLQDALQSVEWSPLLRVVKDRVLPPVPTTTLTQWSFGCSLNWTTRHYKTLSKASNGVPFGVHKDRVSHPVLTRPDEFSVTFTTESSLTVIYRRRGGGGREDAWDRCIGTDGGQCGKVGAGRSRAALPWGRVGLGATLPWRRGGLGAALPWRRGGLCAALPWRRVGLGAALPWPGGIWSLDLALLRNSKRPILLL